MLGKEMLIELERYIQNHLDRELVVCKSAEPYIESEKYIVEEIHQNELENFIETHRKPTLNQVLFRFIDQSSARDSDVYKKAGIDRKHFSKIRTNPNYRPRKNTVIALALALELDFEDTDELLGAAGYSLSDSETYDLVIRFCLEKEIYDLYSVNQALDYFSLKPLV
ncbi:MAG: hypothetical protein ACQEXB_12425 [Bacillota bacterium]